jgi:hypothetical protein
MYRSGPPTIVIGFLCALIGGGVLAAGDLGAALFLIGLALVCAWASDRTRRDGDDHSGLY